MPYGIDRLYTYKRLHFTLYTLQTTMTEFTVCPLLINNGYGGYEAVFNIARGFYISNKEISLTNTNQLKMIEILEGIEGLRVNYIQPQEGVENRNGIVGGKLADYNRQDYVKMCIRSSEGMRVMAWGIMKQNREIAKRGFEAHRDSGTDMITETWDCDNILQQEYTEYCKRLYDETNSNETQIKAMDEMGWWKMRFNGKKAYKYCIP